MCKNTSTQLQEFHGFKAWPSELRAKLFSCSAKGNQTHAHLCPKGHHSLSDPHQEVAHQPSCSTFSIPCIPSPQVRHCLAGCFFFFFPCTAFPTQETVPISSTAASHSSKYTRARGSPSHSCPLPPAPLGQDPSLCPLLGQQPPCPQQQSWSSALACVCSSRLSRPDIYLHTLREFLFWGVMLYLFIYLPSSHFQTVEIPALCWDSPWDITWDSTWTSCICPGINPTHQSRDSNFNSIGPKSILCFKFDYLHIIVLTF